MTDFHMIKIRDQRDNPAWINVRQICAIRQGPVSNAEIYLLAAPPIQCCESVAEVVQLIVNALNGDVTEEPAE